ncbi:hypothetical protein ACO2Q8_07965 [Larkinella sp. VNQ87]|uniref:hypothetical protein n=1 Tax=Larkinella sp. VNQ87 TaxID=3400921 RepID=UPI003C06FA7B
MENLNQRFLKVLDTIGVSGYQLAKESGVSEGTITNIRQGKTKPNTQLIEWILQKYPSVNAEYLFRGTGDPSDFGVNTKQIARGHNQRQLVSVGSGQNNLVSTEECDKLLQAKEETIVALRKTIELYEKLINNK